MFMLLLKMMGAKSFGVGKPVEAPFSVFRVEMPNGNGPFDSELPNSHEIYEHIAVAKPGFDCARFAGENHEHMAYSGNAFRAAHDGHANYGCDSLDAIKQWFPDKARKYLAGLGAKIVQYEVPAGESIVREGHGEVVFNRHAAKVVGEQPL
jgi:hypothetical protein